MQKAQKIGIFSGVFDPVHDGHVEFALAAAKQARLDKVYFLVEAKPRRKDEVTHLAHRIAMVKLAIKAHPNLEFLDLPDRQFSIAKTLPRLNQKFSSQQLFMLCGTDMLEHMPDWPLIDRLLDRARLIVGLRAGFSDQKAASLLEPLPEAAHQALIIPSPADKISSAAIRQTLLSKKESVGLNPQVHQYIKDNWLYVSV